MSELTRESPAKINLTLRVLGLRPDGYHELESLVARISLCDTVTVGPRSDRRRTLACSDPDIPCDEGNLALQAARRLAEAAGISDGVHIAIRKRIPAGAGLGSGSSNAATVLTLLNELWNLGLSRGELASLGAQIGSDVPLFFHAPACVLRGRGEQIEDVEQPLAAWVVLFLPELHCATQAVYRAWDRRGLRPDRPGLPEILAQFRSPANLAGLLFNDLEEAACAAYPELGMLARRLREHCPVPVRMTGAGSALFCLSESRDLAAEIAGRVPTGGPIRVRALTTAIQP